MTTPNPAAEGTAMSATRAGAEAIPAWVAEVLHFWFEQLSEAQWWRPDDTIDALIRDRFLALHEQLAGQDEASATTPHWALATVVVLDQFSRNMFRGSPRAFAADPLARRVSRFAIEQGFDRAMTVPERTFLYLPFEHSEDAGDQRVAVDLFDRLGDESLTRFALAHKAIIDRFGRFPHRNAVLGRRSTVEEMEFLKERGRGF
jgi:uncharacterized protein (DUF924 family)